MPFYVNSVTIGGYLVSPPEMRQTGKGTLVANFVVALNRPGKDRPDYINCVAWKERAVSIQAYGKKGQEITVTGELETSTWTDRNGSKHNTTKIVVERFCLGAMPRTAEANIRKPLPPLPHNRVEE